MANLTQLKMLEDLNGFLLVDKPAGIAFSSVVKAVKRKFNLVKVGHGGSLDAAASGLFVVLVNDANKFVDRVMGADRQFEGTMLLGRTTDTHDVHGRIVSSCDVPTDIAMRLNAKIAGFKGDVFQTEPRFCSVRREGSSDYDVADTGEHAPFLSHVYRLTVETTDRPDRLKFSVFGSKSLLIRTLVNDFGDALGCGACLETLRRTHVGKFTVADAVPFDKLLLTEMKDFSSCVLPLGVALQ